MNLVLLKRTMTSIYILIFDFLLHGITLIMPIFSLEIAKSIVKLPVSYNVLEIFFVDLKDFNSLVCSGGFFSTIRLFHSFQ